MPFYHSRKHAPPQNDEMPMRRPASVQDARPEQGAARQERSEELDLTELEPLPLDEAAAQLEMRPEELLKAFRGGAYRGFVDEGTLFIYVPAEPEGSEHAAPSTGGESRPRSAGYGNEAAVPKNEARHEDERLSRDFAGVRDQGQEQEIERLRKANRELQEEKDRLFRLLEREQVLRQGIQRTLDRAWINLLPPAETQQGAGEAIQTIDRYSKEPQEATRRGATEDAPLDIGHFLGRHD